MTQASGKKEQGKNENNRGVNGLCDELVSEWVGLLLSED